MRHIYFFTFLLSFITLFAWQSYGQSWEDGYRFEKFPTDIGFYNTGVSDILEDHRGFLWMATWSGLVKYDGYKVKMYRQQPGNTNGLKSNQTTLIFEDSKGVLWVGTNYTGFYRYDREQDNFVQYCKNPEDMNSLSSDNVWAIFEDKGGTYWIGTNQGLNRFNPKTNQFIHYVNSPGDSRSLSHNFVYSITETSDGSLWVGTEKGLNRLIRNGDEEYFIRYNLAPEGTSEELLLSHNFIYKIIPSKFEPDVFWVCTSIGLKKVRFSKDNPAFLENIFWGYDVENPNRIISHPFVPDILEEDTNFIWVATYNGLNLLDTERGESKYFKANKNDLNSLSNNVILCLSKDRTGNLWIGTDKGINKLKLNANTFQNFRLNSAEENMNSVTSIVPSGNQKGWWVGARGGGINFIASNEEGKITSETKNYQFATSKFTKLSGFITDLLLDRDGWLWVATDGAGLIRVKENSIPDQGGVISNFQQFTNTDVLSDNYIMSIIQSAAGDIWLGYWDDGIDRYDPVTGIFHHYLVSHDLAINFQQYPIVHLLETIEHGKPYLWAGTRGGGIYKLEFDRKKNELKLVQRFHANIEKDGSLSNDHINAFFIGSQGGLWIGTDSGLNYLNIESGHFTSYFERDGLNNAIIQSILEDKEGNIWVSSQQGISYLSFKAGEISVKNFDTFDGLQGNFFNDDAASITQAGHLIFGGINGLSVFRPEEIRRDNYPPKIAITDFRLSNYSVPIGKLENGKTVLSKNISETTEIELSHRDNVISFEFTGLHFDQPNKIQYAYQLEGFDPDWVYTDASQRIAHYTNLPFEDFIFKVKAANVDGAWSEPVELKLSITPPFWLTGWAYTLYTMLILGLIYFVIRYTRLRAEFRHNLDLERLDREKLQEVNRLKLEFFTNLSHELRTPLTLVISPLEQLLQNPKDLKMHRLFTRMHFNANRLLNMINQLLDIRKSEAGLMKLHVSEGNFVDFSREIVASFKNLSQQRDISLNFSSEKETIKAWFDQEQLEKVLFNLLSNAFKFMNDGGRVTVNVFQTDHIFLTISDTGIGIPPGQIQNIFDRFYQVERGKEWTRKSGTGIGLSLAKMIMEKHHGKISVKSEEGIGTTFTISLLPGNTHFQETELTPGESYVGKMADFILPETSPELPKMPDDFVAATNGNKTKPIILIVEDNPDVRAYLRENLEPEYSVMEASDGIEGLKKAIEEPPSLIIADIAMPKMDGIEMCGKVKSSIETSHVPVILLTARTSLVFQLDGLETGADDYVTKPFHMRLLLARIKNLINSRKKIQDHFSKEFNFGPDAPKINSLDKKLLDQVKFVIERHLDDSSFTVDQLASSLSMSRIQLYRKLKSLTGKSPNQIIRGFRLKRAVQLLETGQFNVSDVTYMVGYNDLKSFREQFKKEYGISPSGYNK